MAKRLFLLLLSSFIGICLFGFGFGNLSESVFNGKQVVLAEESSGLDSEMGDSRDDTSNTESFDSDSESKGDASVEIETKSENNSSPADSTTQEKSVPSANRTSSGDSSSSGKTSSTGDGSSSGNSSSSGNNTTSKNNTSSEEQKPSAHKTSVVVHQAPANSVNIAGRSVRIVDVSDTMVDSGDYVNKYGSKFLYGHNSGAVFGSLKNLGVGNTFSVTYGGVTTKYRISKVVVFEKNASNGRLQLNGSGNFMRSVANAKIDGISYDLSVMTCHGTSYGNGDASHRLVLFANAI